MALLVVILPHERDEAIEAWKDMLSPAHIRLIQNAPETAAVRLYISGGARILDVLPVVTTKQ